MKKRYIISTSNLSGEDQVKKFANALTGNDLAWWHWLSNTWLVIDYKGAISADGIANAMRLAFPSAWFLILEYKPNSNWIAYGPTGSGKIDTDMIAWIREHWVKSDENISSFLT